MVQLQRLASLIVGLGCISDVLAAPAVDYRNGTNDATVQAASCVATSFAQVEQVLASGCQDITIKSIVVPAKPPGSIALTLNLKRGQKLTADEVTFQGTTTFQSYSGARATYTKGGKKPEWYLLSISGDGVTVQGAPGDNLLDGNGQKYWDGIGSNTGGTYKPKFVRFDKLRNSVVQGLNFKNTPIHAFSIDNCQSVVFDRISLDNAAGKESGGRGKSLGHNTDAFDVHGTSNDITIKNANILNQDDCLAVNSGSKIKFLDSKCVGGHGISIGSIRSGAKVDGVTVSNCIVSDSENGVRIKTWDGESGASVRNVQYSNITLNAIDKMGIVVRQDYLNDGPTGKQARGSITVEGLVMRNIRGTVVGKANSVYINCSPGMCKNWQMSDINVKGGTITCMEAPAGARPPCPH